MRHDPASSALVIMLRSLKMYGMAQAVDELAESRAGSESKTFLQAACDLSRGLSI